MHNCANNNRGKQEKWERKTSSYLSDTKFGLSTTKFSNCLVGTFLNTIDFLWRWHCRSAKHMRRPFELDSQSLIFGFQSLKTLVADVPIAATWSGIETSFLHIWTWSAEVMIADSIEFCLQSVFLRHGTMHLRVELFNLTLECVQFHFIFCNFSLVQFTFFNLLRLGTVALLSVRKIKLWFV